LAHWHIIITFAAMNITLTPEEQLVLAAMKLKPTAAEIARMEGLVAEVQDWNYCTRLAIDRGIGPLLNHKIPMLANSHLIPPDAQARLQQSYLRTLARSMRLYEAFREVGTALNNAGIKFVALKGVYLAEALYEDIGLRLFSDIDLLVTEEDGERSLEVLREVGYANPDNKIIMTEFIEKNKEIVHYDPIIKGDVSVEIHIKLHRTTKDYHFNIPEMLANAIPVTIFGISAFVLKPSDLIVHLCVHADKHFKQGHVQFTGYMDIINWLEKNNLNTSELLERCKLHQCEGPVLNQLSLLSEFCGLNYISEQNNTIIKLKLKSSNIEQFLKIFRGEKIGGYHLAATLNDYRRLGKSLQFFKYVWDIIHPDKAFMVHRYKIKNPAYYRVYYLVRYWEGLKALLKSVIAFIPRRKSA
jgi:hypothetical protein